MNIIERKSSRTFVSFAAKPATKEETRVATVVEELALAYNQRALEKIKNIFSEDASIERISVYGIINKNEYIKWLSRRISNIDFFTIDETTITMDGISAKVYGIATFCLINDRPRSVELILKLRRENDQWFIYETRIPSRHVKTIKPVDGVE